MNKGYRIRGALLGHVACFLLLLLALWPEMAFTAGGGEEQAGLWQGKKILWVDSYHEGYAWSQGLERGIRGVLADRGIDLKIFRMDTNRNRSGAYGRQAGLLARTMIKQYRPDLVIASDDNAQKYLVVPYLKDTDLPVVFCGVNRDPAEYGYPCQNVTGMREVDFAVSLSKQMRSFAGGERIGLLISNTETAQIVADHYQRVLGGELAIYRVNTLAEFKQAFLRAQREVNVLHLRNNEGILGWDDSAAEAFLAESTRIPTGSVNRWMSKFVVFNLAKKPEEHGKYSASIALHVLNGMSPQTIPVSENKEAHLVVNLKMAQAAGIVMPVSLLRTADLIGAEALIAETIQ